MAGTLGMIGGGDTRVRERLVEAAAALNEGERRGERGEVEGRKSKVKGSLCNTGYSGNDRRRGNTIARARGQ